MLQQILRDMYIEPELLAELDEEQKQVLFCKMREEQIRRWKVREEELEKEEKNSQKPQKSKGPKVNFHNGADGQPWTWVMGEHRDDKTVDQIFEEEAHEKARKMAELEAAATIKKFQEDEELGNKLSSQSFSGNQTEKTVQEIWRKNVSVNDYKKSPSSQPKLEKPSQATTTQKTQQAVNSVPLRKTGLSQNMVSCVMSAKEQRSSEIYASMQMGRQKSIEEADKETPRIDQFWKEQERKAKQEEEKQRLLAKKVREDHRKSVRRLKTESQIIGSFMTTFKQAGGRNDRPVPGAKTPTGRPPRPSSKEDVLKWFREKELPKGSGLNPVTKHIAEYFHGAISREDAEMLLMRQPVGSYLIRLSDKIWGYGLSYRGPGDDKSVKHYLIDVTDRGYQFFGTNQLVHASLAEFVKHYEVASMCLMNKEELLRYPCPRSKPLNKDLFDLVSDVHSTGKEDVEVSYL